MARPEVEPKTPLGKRLREVRAASGDPERDEFAVQLGINKSSVANYERGERIPDADTLAAYSRIFNVNLNWLVSGEGGMFRTALDMIMHAERRAEAEKLLRTMPSTTDRQNFVYLPIYEGVLASAGPGASPAVEDASAVLAFERQFLRDRGAAPDSCTVIKARGDSMMPTIPDGSLLVVDHSQREVANGYITVIGIGDDLLVKRIRRRLDGMIDLISDNAAYAVETIPADRLDQLRIIGRVIYFCRTP